MSSGPPPGAAGPSNTNGQRIQHMSLQQQAAQSTNPGNIYSFSVHQPYTNWPLNAAGAHYAPSWYPLPPQAYGHPPRSYREAHVQTDARNAGNGKAGEPQYRRHWDAALSAFLKNAGLHQALRGLRDDIMMMSESWEKERVPIALQTFVKDLSEIDEDAKEEDALPEKPLEDRRLEYVRAQSGVSPQTPSNLTKSISRFLKESRKRNDSSNRAEFLLSLAEKRRKLNEQDDSPTQTQERAVGGEGSLHTPANGDRAGPDATVGVPSIAHEASAIPTGPDVEAPSSSCARTDAKRQDRDVQMKYDIAKNEDGPLKRTMKGGTNPPDSIGSGVHHSIVFPDEKGKQSSVGEFGYHDGNPPTADRHPGLSGRFKDIESHLAVRYVPSPPHSLVDRIKFLEDHIIKLEKDYPPWAALHFNQPNRGWPAPPRLTPIIVAPHLTSTKTDQGTILPSSDGGARSTAKVKQTKAKSSLHRAVMEKLEIQRAIGDLASGS